MKRQSPSPRQLSKPKQLNRIQRLIGSSRRTLAQCPDVVRRLLCDPVDIASLVFFRIAFGAIMLWEVVRYFQFDRISRYYIEPKFQFKYFGFEWVQAWPGNGMYWHFAALGLLAVLIMVGCCYRLAATLFFCGFSYVFLLDQTQHLNHFYLISLISFLLILMPLHRAGSVDAWLRPSLKTQFVPGWSLRLLQAQIAIVYFYGGIAKLNSDWLNCRPVAGWVSARADLPLIGPWLAEPAAGWIVAYGGLLFDLVVAPLLCWRKTRPYAFAVAILFHLSNSLLFHIGIFPWFMMAATAMFFRPDWPRKLLPVGLRGANVVRVAMPLDRWQRAGIAFTLVYIALQVAIPLRHFIYPGNTNWNELGHRFSWHMKLRSKQGRVGFLVKNPRTGQSWWYNMDRTLNERQMSKMAGRPDMLLQMAHHIRNEYRGAGVGDVEVYVETWISLNGHDFRRLIDPTVNLAAEERTLAAPHWIVPFDAKWNSHWPSIGRLFTQQTSGAAVAHVRPSHSGPAATGPSNTANDPVGTRVQRIELFKDLLSKTLAREAFSPVKNRRLGLDFATDAKPLRADFAAATTERELFQAVVRFSNLRKNAHLRVYPPQHLRRSRRRWTAPIRFLPDYSSTENISVFVSDIGEDFNRQVVESIPRNSVPVTGDRLIEVNGFSVEEYCSKLAPWLRASTRDGLSWKFAEELATYHPDAGLDRFSECIQLTLENTSGQRYRLTLPYLAEDQIRWRYESEPPRCKGFDSALHTESFVLYRPNSAERKTVLLRWVDFGSTLTDDVDRLMNYAAEQGLLHHDVICDLTGSGGGQRAWYLLQRLVQQPFKVTYGNLRISDVTNSLASTLSDQNVSSPRLDAWFQTDVEQAIQAGLPYTNPVPFKLRALPVESDGILQPAEQRFLGRTVCLFGPEGVSQVDQFAAMFIDNQLGHSIGMPTHGSSNTWEWREPVVLPGTNLHVATMMWSLGNTIRPNGKVLEGNPPQPAENIPLTRQNHAHYLNHLIERARHWLQQTNQQQTTVGINNSSL